MGEREKIDPARGKKKKMYEPERRRETNREIECIRSEREEKNRPSKGNKREPERRGEEKKGLDPERGG